jgi:homoserine/homoserine lactone efflux protein
MLFFVAFLPQFVSPEAPAVAQLLLLAATFMLLTTIVDTSYALLSARIGSGLHDPRWIRTRDRVSGMVLVLAAVVFIFLGAE